MTQQTHIERLAGRQAAARGRARQDPVIGTEDDGGGGPVVTAARAVEGANGAWTVGSIVAGRFVLQQRLGRGRYGPIFKALDRSLSEALIGVEHHVALQELHPRVAAQPTLIERLEQLPFHPQSWSHPNIVKLGEFGRDGTKYFLCEELLEGASLRMVLDESAPEPLGQTEALGVLRSVGDALNYAHVKGIVHGDVRPENVFVTGGYTVKVLGLLPGNEPRTLPFFPEDAANGGQPHPSDDVYGLACLAYELLTGRHPYNGNSPLEALRAGLAPHPVPNWPPLRWQALARGLALRRERRTASIPELLAGLGVTGTESLHPPPEEAPPAAPLSRAQPAADEWPKIQDPVAEAGRAPAAVRAVPAPAARPTPPRDEWFAARAPDDEVPAWDMRGLEPESPSHAVRTVLALILAAGLGVLAYLDHARLRGQATDLIETGVAFASAEWARWQSPPVVSRPVPASSPAPSAAAPAAEPAVPVETAAATPAPAPAAPAADEPVETPFASQPTSVTVAVPAAPTRFEFAQPTLTVSEWEASARIVIRRTGSLAEEASVAWWTVDRTAVADEDYAVLGARIETFAPGEETRVVHVPIINDSMPEPRETFVVNLRSERVGAGSASQLEVVVLDDDS